MDETGTTPAQDLGYYSVSAGKVAREHLPKALGPGGQVEVPAVLICGLAKDASRRGQGLGEVLHADAFSRIRGRHLHRWARFVLVESLRESAAVFCEWPGLRRLPSRLLLVQKVANIQATHDAYRPVDQDRPAIWNAATRGN